MKKYKNFFFSIFIILALVFIGFFVYSIEKNFVWYWGLGIAVGFVLQHFHICFVSTVSDPFFLGTTERFRALLIGILGASLGVITIKYLSDGTLDMLGVSTINVPLMLGSFIFGVGMILSGCCPSGMFVRLSEGYTIHIFTIVSVIGGYLFANSHYSSVWAPLIFDTPAIFLPNEIGWMPGVIANVLLILVLYLVALRYEKNRSSSNISKYLIGAICLAIISVIHYIVLKSGLSVTGAFFWLGSMPSDNITAAIAPNLRNIGIFAGSLLSACMFKRFKLQKIRSMKQIYKTVIGGLLIGYGSCIAGGCTLSAFFVSAASLSLSAWIFMIFLFLGDLTGIKILHKFL